MRSTSRGWCESVRERVYARIYICRQEEVGEEVGGSVCTVFCIFSVVQK